MNLRSWCGVALAALAACAPEPPGDAPADATRPEGWIDSAGVLEPGLDPDSASALDRYIAAGPLISARTRAELKELLGAPDSAIAVAIPNRHVAGQIDSLVTLHFDDVSATLYAVTGGGEILNSMTIRDNRWLREGPVRIGSAWADVGESWGGSAQLQGNPYHFECRRCVVPESVILDVRAGRIEAIRFEHYVD